MRDLARLEMNWEPFFVRLRLFLQKNRAFVMKTESIVIEFLGDFNIKLRPQNSADSTAEKLQLQTKNVITKI